MPDPKVQKLQVSDEGPSIRIDEDYPDVAYLNASGVKYFLAVNGDGTLTIDLRATKRNQAIEVTEDSRERVTIAVTPGEPE